MKNNDFALRISNKHYKQIFVLACIGMVLSILGPFSVYLLQKTVQRIDKRKFSVLVVLLLFFLTIKSLNMLGEPLLQYLSKRFSIRLSNELRCDYIGSIQTISYEAYNHLKSVELIDKIEILDTYANSLITPVLNLCKMIPSLIIAVIFLFLLKWELMFWIIIPIPIWMLSAFFLNRLLKKLRLKRSKMYSKILDFIEAFLRGIVNILSFSMFLPTIQSYLNLEKTQIKVSANETACSTVRRDINEFLLHFVVVIIFINASFEFSLDIAALVGVYYLVPYIYQPLFSYNDIVDQVTNLRVQKQRLTEVTDLFRTEVKPIPPFCSIVLKDICYHFSNQSKNQLENISLCLDKPGCIVFIGESGEGKTTLLEIMSGIRQPTQGDVMFQSSPHIHNSEEKFQHIGFQKQNPSIFSMSVLENITMGKDIPKEQIEDVCKKLNIYDEILSLPKGFDTLLGEKGQNLSVGQMQRIALARTILQDSFIMIFDEPTSALDVVNEQHFSDLINELRKDHLVIMVTHSNSLLKIADFVYCVAHRTITLV